MDKTIRRDLKKLSRAICEQHSWPDLDARALYRAMRKFYKKYGRLPRHYAALPDKRGRMSWALQ